MVTLNPKAKMKEKHEALSLNTQGIEKTARLVWALNHPLRQKMLKAIYRAGSIKVTNLCVAVNEAQPVVSQNLSVLRKFGFVQATSEGRNVWYSVNLQRVEQVQQLVRHLLNGHQRPK
jgi:DNA-binding transcriptional ArsR family regulator